jgi:hypothetical protein
MTFFIKQVQENVTEPVSSATPVPTTTLMEVEMGEK